MRGSSDTLDVADAMEFAEVLYKCRLCTVVPCVVSSKYVFSLHVRSIHLTSAHSLPLARCTRCQLKFATEEDLFDHKKQTHGITEDQLDLETGKENDVTTCGHRTDVNHTRPLPHGIDGENSSKDSPMHAVQHTRYNADEEHDCVSEDETTGAEDANINTHRHMGETHETHNVSDTSDGDHHTGITDNEREVQRTVYNILPVNRGLASSTKRCHTESCLPDDPQRFVYLTAPDTEVVDHAQSLAGSHTNSPKSKRKRTIPVACRSVPMQSPMSDMSTEDSDLDMYDLHTHTTKDVSADKDDSSHIDEPANDMNDDSNTEIPVSSAAEIVDNSQPLNGRLRALDIQKYVKSEWSLGPFVSSFRDNASPHSDGSVMPPAGENEKQCLYCDYRYVDFEDYSQHYTDRHVTSSSGTVDVKQDPANSSQFLGEPFVTKSNKIKEILPDFLCVNVNGCVSRSALMDRLGERLQQTDLTNWAPACNKAIRELFPHSQALRKGKYKKTYFYGIQFVGSVAATLSTAEKMDFVLDEDDPNFIPSPLRDMGKDTERLLKVLPCVIRFTGHMNNCVTRDMLLYILSEQLNEPDVTNWGTQCNRAVRHLYPQTYLKRKGKFKTTCYFGIQLQDYIEARTPGKFGPPVVDVRDIISDDMIRKWEGEPPVGGATRWSADGRATEGVREEKPGERAEETKVAIKQEPMEEPSFSNLEDASPTLTSPAADRNVLERMVLLHPGPFVTERILRHRCMSLKPTVESVQLAMTTLETRGLGEVRNVRPSNLRVFYKAMPHDSLEEDLSAFNVRLVDYQLMFSERDPKLEDSLHDQVKMAGPNLDTLPLFYKY